MKMDIDGVSLATIIGLAMAVVRVAEKVISWGTRRVRNGHGRKDVAVVQLDPESSRMVRDTYERVKEIDGVIGYRDQAGTPMVYFSRSSAQEIHEIHDGVQDVGKDLVRANATVDEILKVVKG